MTVYDFPQSICLFGAARCDITPPVGIYHRMWGAAEYDRSQGVHRPLTATVMVFRSTDASSINDCQMLIAIDHCLLFDRQVRDLIETVSQASSFPADRIVTTFSHTHAAGLMDARRASLPGGEMIAPYLEKMSSQIAAAAQQAIDGEQLATINYATGRCSLAAHRDFWDDANKLFVCGFNPHESADDTLLVARVCDEAGAALAVIVNYACHPTTLAWDNRLISPDFPGAMREVVEQATGALCVFLQGASGDLGPRDGFTGDVSVADRNGRQLGYAALSALESAPAPRTRMAYQGPVLSGATIGVWNHETFNDDDCLDKKPWRRLHTTVRLPYRGDLPTPEQARVDLDKFIQAETQARHDGDLQHAADARAMAERMNRWLARMESFPPGDAFPYPMTAWRLGDAIWLAVQGEPYSLLQRTLRQRFFTAPIVIAELANGSQSWYLPTCETYGKGIYQETMAHLSKGCLETVIDAAAQIIANLLNECLVRSDEKTS